MLALARDETMRARLAELVAAVDDGEVDGDIAELLESVLELGLQTGRIRAYYGPGGEQAALATLAGSRAGARAPRARARSPRRSRRSPGDDRARRRSPPSRPAAFTLSIEAGRRRASCASTATAPACEPRRHEYAATTWRASTSAGRECLVVGGGRVATEKATACSTARPT